MSFARRAAIVVALAACVAPCASVQSEDRRLRAALTQEPSTINPITATQLVSSDVIEIIQSGLLSFDDRGNLVPRLARDVPTMRNGGISSDGKTFVYHLVRDAKWSDGAPVTSDDVKFTVEQILNPKNAVATRAGYEEIQKIETPDPYTVRVTLRRRWAPFVGQFLRGGLLGAVIPAHVLRKYPDLNKVDFEDASVGSGPYKITAWNHASDMTFEARPDYFLGEPKIKRITLRFIETDNTALALLRTGELDFIDRLGIAAYSQLGTVPGMVPALASSLQWEHLTFNAGRAPLSDRQVRLALCYATDVHQLYAKLYHGLGILGPTAENPQTPWYNRRVDYYPFDPAKAAKILDADGWAPGPDGIRVKNGNRLSITFMTTAGNLTREQTEVVLQQAWHALGVDVTIKNEPSSMLFALAADGGPLTSGNYDVALSSFVLATTDPSRLDFNGADRIPPNGNNTSRYVNPELTKLENDAAETYDFSARKRMYDRAQEIIIRDVPYYNLRWGEILDMRSTALQNVRPPLSGSTFWNVSTWQF